MERNLNIDRTEKPSGNASGRKIQPNSTTLDLKAFAFSCLGHWQWFVISVIVCLAVGVFKILKTPEVYSRTASIMLKTRDNGGVNTTLEELGIEQSSTNVTNELIALRTTAVAKEIVTRLDLNVNYSRKGTFHNHVLYGVNLPVRVHFLDLNDNENASLSLELAGEKCSMSEFVRNGESVPTNITVSFSDTVSTPIGRIVVEPSPFHIPGETGLIQVNRYSINGATASVRGRISAELGDKNSSIINISFRDTSPARAEDVLNTLVSVYNENWVKDRNQVTVSTNEFIQERLAVIEEELGNVDQDISSYKSQNLVPDVAQASSMAMSQASAAEQQTSTISSQIYMAKYVKSYLTDGHHDNQLLPSNSGIENGTIAAQIAEYNSILLKRNNHLAISSLQNPLVMDLDQNLATLRRSIISSLDNEITMLETRLKNAQSSYRQATSRIVASPGQAKYLLSVERQQKVKESLYLFLLQKREENELNQAFTAYNTRLIEPPYGSMVPVAPEKSSILLIALVIGLLLPMAVLFLKELLNTTVRDSKDLGNIQAPFLGEIPLYVSKNRRKVKRKKGEEDSPKVIVQEKSRNMMNEAFRVIRANLQFVIGFEGKHKVLMLTSINPGSGKTFITANLATALSITGQKVIAVDLDLRKGSLSKYVDSPEVGISNYLSGQTNNWKGSLVKLGNVDVLPCGSIPPNPSELILDTKFKRMIEELREEYDVVFLDCPPIEIVADTSIVAQYADTTMFVVRTGLMDRSLLPEVNKWYGDHKYGNISVILNGTDTGSNYYSYTKYGYSYGGYDK